MNIGGLAAVFGGYISSRKKICIGCIANTGGLNEDLGRCMECGCYLKAKILIKSTSCPLKKW